MSNLSAELSAKRDTLLAWLRGVESCAVAFSGGVDSAVLAKAAQLALGEGALAVTGTSDSLAQGELDEARALARMIGIRHAVIETDEFANPDYLKNSPDRCYHCKTELYEQMGDVAPRFGAAVTLNGANLDDAGDHRPGMVAARENGVRSPLIECGLTKQEVRELAADWGLPVWDKPATPCLSSRVAYGEDVTPQRLKMIDQAERYLRQRGLREVRVRYHKGDLARIEVPLVALAQLADPAVVGHLAAHFRSLGFLFVTLDLEGFRSGSLNQLVPESELRVLK